MLTDYHVHLRPDEPENTAEDHFTPANAARYDEALEYLESVGVSELAVVGKRERRMEPIG